MTTCSFGSVARIFNGNSISTSEKDKFFRGVEGLPYIGTAQVGFDAVINYDSGVTIPPKYQSRFKLAKAGTPLVCAEGGSAGRKIGLLDRDALFGNKLFALEPIKSWDGRFLYYFCLCSAFQKQFLNMTTGLIGGVSLKKFKEIRVPAFSFTEQRRIVTMLDEAFAWISAATSNTLKNLNGARTLFEVFLNAAFDSSGGDAHSVRLADICLRGRIITYGVIKLGSETPGGVPCLRTSNVRASFELTDSSGIPKPAAI